jgi:hypothetical protein
MGESAAETVKEIEHTRERLEGELQELQERLPAPAVWTKRLIGLAVGGGTASILVLTFLRRRKRRKDERIRRLQSRTRQAVIQVLPEAWAERFDGALADGRWKPWAAGAAGLYAAFRLAEIRQLRRMNRALLTGRR